MRVRNVSIERLAYVQLANGPPDELVRNRDLGYHGVTWGWSDPRASSRIENARFCWVFPKATNDAHYTTRDDADAHDILLCIGTGKDRNDPRRLRFHGQESYFKSHEQMARAFPENPEAIENTLAVAERWELLADPVGSTQIFLSEPVVVVPGEQIEWRLAQNLRESTIYVW